MIPAMTHSQMPVGRRWFKRCPIGNSMWLVFNGWVTCKYHIAAPRQGILSILVFFLTYLPSFTVHHFCLDTRCHRLASSLSLQTPYWLCINRSNAWPEWLQKSALVPAQGEVMMTERGSRSVAGSLMSVRRLCHVCSSLLSQQAVSLETLWMFWIPPAPSCTGTCPSRCKSLTASSGRCLVVSASCRFFAAAAATNFLRSFTSAAFVDA